MASVWQEMHCSECQSYFGFFLETTFSGDVVVSCGICKHHHYRNVDKGRIVSDAKKSDKAYVIEIMRSQCYPESRVSAMKEVSERFGRKGEAEELDRPMTQEEAFRQETINELWLNKFAREMYGD